MRIRPQRPIATRLGCLLPLLLLTTACATTERFGQPGQPLERLGDEIVVCGQLIHTGAPVVLWMDPGGYDAYRAECHFEPGRLAPSKPVSDAPIRYGSFRRHLPDDVAQQVRTAGWTLPLLAEWVDLFVLHYDACGTSRRCFDVLHDRRGLSVHFMLDVDGTIYQTLDVKERAWHAGSANDRSVGVEIANIGAYGDMQTLDEWYGHDEDARPYITFPAWLGETGIRTPNFVARPACDDLVIGSINGRELRQYDFTHEQYDSLTKLIATLSSVLPQIRLDYPRNDDDRLRTTILSPTELSNFTGVLGHWHITKSKVDPGPALDWDRLLKDAHELVP